MNTATIEALMRAVAAAMNPHLEAIKAALDAIRNRVGTTDALIDDLERRLAALEQDRNAR